MKDEDVEFTPNKADGYVNIELSLDCGGEHTQLSWVIKKMKDNEGNMIGMLNSNLIIDTRVYEVEYEDGHRK